MRCCTISQSRDARAKCCDLFASTMLLALLSGGHSLAGHLQKTANPDHVSFYEICPLLAYTASAVLILMVGVMAVRSVAQTGIIVCRPDYSSKPEDEKEGSRAPRR